METKKCSTCKEVYPITEYRKDTSRKSGIHCTCNTCNRAIQRKWYQQNKAKARTASKKNYHDKKETINAKRKKAKRWRDPAVKARKKEKYLANPDLNREKSWKRAGIKNMTVKRYDTMFSVQKGCCYICKTPQEQLNRRLNVDHNHDTGEVRALLCDACNRALGYFKDSAIVVESAHQYLLKFNT